MQLPVPGSRPGKEVRPVNYASPNLEVKEKFEEVEQFFAPKLPWLTLVACVLITVGQTLAGP